MFKSTQSKRKVYYFILLMLFWLTACGNMARSVQNNTIWKALVLEIINIENSLEIVTSKIMETDMEVAESSSKKEEMESSYNISYCADWQLAYLDKLGEIRENNRIYYADVTDPNSKVCPGYHLYDVDYDGMPELILSWGRGEASRHWEIYTYQDSKIVLVGETSGGHTAFYTYPSKQAILLVYSNGSYWQVDEVTIEDGQMTRKVLDKYDENDINSCLDMSNYDKASAGMPGFDIEVDLPILEYDEDAQKDILYWEIVKEDEAEVALKEALNNKRNIYAVQTTRSWLFKDKWITDFYILDEIVQGKTEGHRYEDLAVTGISWIDFNQDGTNECLVAIGRGEKNHAMLILSYQEGTVYGYYLDPIYWDADKENCYNSGIIYDDIYDQYYGIHFYKDQAYQVRFYDLNNLGEKAKWETYEP